MIVEPKLLSFERHEYSDFYKEIQTLSNLWLGGVSPEENLSSHFPMVSQFLESQ